MTSRTRVLSLFAVAALTLSACGSTASSSAQSSSSAAQSSSQSSSTDSAQKSEASQATTIIDVRTPEEFATGHVDGAVNIDIHSPDFAAQIQKLDPNGDYSVYCRSGNRSGQAVQFMTQNGFTNVKNLGALQEAAQELGLPIVK